MDWESTQPYLPTAPLPPDQQTEADQAEQTQSIGN